VTIEGVSKVGRGWMDAEGVSKELRMTLCPRVFQSRKSANIFSRYAPDRPTERRRFNREAGRLRYGSADDLPMICR
jgi:hypothetical protein